jgi:hypothetical protein
MNRFTRYAFLLLAIVIPARAEEPAPPVRLADLVREALERNP